MKLFQHPSWPLKIIVLVCASGLLLAGGSGLIHALRGQVHMPGLLFSLFVLMWAAALVRMTAWAGMLVSALLLMNAILMPVGLLSPFSVSESLAAGQEPLSLGSLLLIAVPVLIVCLVMVHILGKYRDEFTRRWI